MLRVKEYTINKTNIKTGYTPNSTGITLFFNN